MPHTKSLTGWQTVAALATEGACLLPYLLALLGGVIFLYRPPYRFFFMPASVQSLLIAIATALLYGAIKAPLRFWRTAFYVRLCDAGDTLPSLRPTGHGVAAIAWRWHLWVRRTIFGTVTCLPGTLLIGYGTAARTDNTILPAVCLTVGAVVSVIGVVVAAIWQCRYALAPLFVLRGEPSAAAMALSARAMRGHITEYINFLGGELVALLPCLLLFPIVRRVPIFRQRRTAFLLHLLPPDR